MPVKKTIPTFSLLTACLFLFSISACSEKSQINESTSSQTETFSPKTTTLDTALIDSSTILPSKASKNTVEVDPDRPHTLNGSN